MHMRMDTYACVYVYMYLRGVCIECMYIRIHVGVSVCMYVFIDVYTYIYVYTYL